MQEIKSQQDYPVEVFVNTYGALDKIYAYRTYRDARAGATNGLSQTPPCCGVRYVREDLCPPQDLRPFAAKLNELAALLHSTLGSDCPSFVMGFVSGQLRMMAGDK